MIRVLLPVFWWTAVSACTPTPLLIRNVDLWTPKRIEPGRDVLMRDGRIARVAKPGMKTGPGVRVVEARGDTLLPGFIDSHIHFVMPGGMPKPDGVPARDALEITGRQSLASGVTYGRLHLAKLADAQALKQKSKQPCAPMPELEAGGPAIGGGAKVNPEAQYTGIDGAANAAAHIERSAQAGLDWVAVHEADKLSTEERTAIRNAAQRFRMKLLVQVTSREHLAAAKELGPNTIDYIDRTNAPQYDTALLSELVSKSRPAFFVPMIGIFERFAAALEQPEQLESAANLRLLQDRERGPIFENARRDLRDNPYVKDNLAARHTFAAKLQQLRATGIPVAIGTDAGSPAHFAGDAIWWELEAWRRAGVPTHEVLQAATSIPAKALGLRDRGELRPGARADFVLYRGKVLEGAFEVDRVRAVGKAGVLFVDEFEWIEPARLLSSAQTSVATSARRD
jgi:imidazolonepropionase-like amidohydrolase